MIEGDHNPIEFAADPFPPTEIVDEEIHPITTRDGMILIGLSSVWPGPPKPSEPCSCCGDRPKPSHYCLRCDRFGGDGVRELPGLPIGEYIDPDYVEND